MAIMADQVVVEHDDGNASRYSYELPTRIGCSCRASAFDASSNMASDPLVQARRPVAARSTSSAGIHAMMAISNFSRLESIGRATASIQNPIGGRSNMSKNPRLATPASPVDNERPGQ
jgi:hypothetical protein